MSFKIVLIMTCTVIMYRSIRFLILNSRRYKRYKLKKSLIKLSNSAKKTEESFKRLSIGIDLSLGKDMTSINGVVQEKEKPDGCSKKSKRKV